MDYIYLPCFFGEAFRWRLTPQGFNYWKKWNKFLYIVINNHNLMPWGEYKFRPNNGFYVYDKKSHMNWKPILTEALYNWPIDKNLSFALWKDYIKIKDTL